MKSCFYDFMTRFHGNSSVLEEQICETCKSIILCLGTVIPDYSDQNQLWVFFGREGKEDGHKCSQK